MHMLKWFPTSRSSAKDMLKHPWLSMKDDYNPKVSDLEFQKTSLKRQQQDETDAVDICQLVQTDDELNQGDYEDNLDSDWSEANSMSFEAQSTTSDQDEFNLNVSFSGGYMPNTDLSRVDKSTGNPQFKDISVKV